MPKSLSKKVVRFLSPFDRLRHSIRSLGGDLNHMSSKQEQVLREVRRIYSAVSQTQTGQHPTVAAPAAIAPFAPASANAAADLDRWAARELQSAVVQNLPFLPGEINLGPDGITVEGYAGAPEGLTNRMAFFINGRRFTSVEYPIPDPGLQAKFTEVRGMGLVFRARMTEHLDELRAARFWRLDASPMGGYVPSSWRQAIHFMNPAFERYPLPPTPNIQRVIGDTSATRFALGGAMIFKNFEAYLQELGCSWADFPRILDWGCGAGRVTRYLLGETDSTITGADVDVDNIAWCKSAYPEGDFHLIPLRPPTAFPDEYFDMIIGLSVLTHLRENDQWLWLAELQRISRPGAIILLSVQGPTQFGYNSFPSSVYRRLQDEGFIDFSRDPALDLVIDDPDYYRASMHSRPYIVDRWSKYFEVQAIVDAIAGLQDVVVMRRRS